MSLKISAWAASNMHPSMYPLAAVSSSFLRALALIFTSSGELACMYVDRMSLAACCILVAVPVTEFAIALNCVVAFQHSTFSGLNSDRVNAKKRSNPDLVDKSFSRNAPFQSLTRRWGFA